MNIKKQGKKILLLFKGPEKEGKDYFSNFVPMGLFNILYYLLQNGYDARLYNLSFLNSDEIVSLLKSIDFQVVFLSAFTGNHMVTLKLASRIKKIRKDCVVVIGGPFAILGDYILQRYPEVDFVIKGEGEEASLKIIRFLEGRERVENISGLYYRNNEGIKSNRQLFEKEIDNFFFLPSQVIAYCNFVNEENFAILITSRGCPYRCSFCSSYTLWRNKIRYHSIDNLIRYVKDLRYNLGQIYFSIRDDNFLMNRERVISLTKRFEKERLMLLWNTQASVSFIDDEIALRLANGGCDQVQMGIESASLRILNFFNKKLDINLVGKAVSSLRKHLIRPFGYFIGGVNETEKEVEETCDFIRKVGLMDGILSPLVIYPGTKLYKNSMIDDFFSKKEILFFSLSSYIRFKNQYLSALKYAFHRNTFKKEEIEKSPTISFLKEVVLFYHYIMHGNREGAQKVVLRLDFSNPWRKKLLEELNSL